MTKIGPIYRKQTLKNDLQSNNRLNDSWYGLIGLLMIGDMGWMTNH